MKVPFDVNLAELKAGIASASWLPVNVNRDMILAGQSIDGEVIDVSYVVKIPKDSRRTNFKVPDTIKIPGIGLGEFSLRDGAHCVMCHGSGHRIEQCSWKKMIQQASFDLSDLEAALPNQN